MRSARDVARNIVNQLLDESGASVEHRQAINDRCDAFTETLLAEWVEEQRGEWERVVLERFTTTMPPTGEAPDYLYVVTNAMIESRVADQVLHGEGSPVCPSCGETDCAHLVRVLGQDAPVADLPPEEPCPDCGNDPEDETVHRDSCPRLNTTGQFGPPWKDPPWPPMCRPDSWPNLCFQPKDHDGPCDKPEDPLPDDPAEAAIFTHDDERECRWLAGAWHVAAYAAGESYQGQSECDREHPA